MPNAYFTIAKPANDPFKGYLPGSTERAELKAELAKQSSEIVKIPLIIGGKEVWTDRTIKVTMPHDHEHVIAECCMAGEKELKMAIEAALAAKADWEAMPWEHRSAIFLKAADMITGSYRKVLNAATMLGQSKTVFQAEIDIAELADFLRFGVWSAQEIFKDQPASEAGIWNRQDYRPLDGFICAITPFNFTSIGGNLATAPAIVGNVALWKPSRTAVLSNYYYMKLLMWCGLPAGVINFVPCTGGDMAQYVVSHPKMAGFHFTGSTAVFQSVWKQVGENIASYANYPRLVGETGGKDFIFAHNTADIKPLAAAIVRGSFEFQGQKCSACSRAFIPASIWPEVETLLKVYVEGARDADAMLGRLVDYFSATDEPVVLAFWGDHLPYLGDNQLGYEELGSEVALSEEERSDPLCSYETPYVIWANDAAAEILDWDAAVEALDLPESHKLSASFLGAALVELTGRTGESPWFDFLNQLRRELPVVQKKTYLTMDSTYTKIISSEQEQLIHQWRKWSYYKLRYKDID